MSKDTIIDMWKNLNNVDSDHFSKLTYLGYDMDFLKSDEGLQLMLQKYKGDNGMAFDRNYKVYKVLPALKTDIILNKSNPTVWNFKFPVSSPIVTHPKIEKYEQVLRNNFDAIKAEYNSIKMYMNDHPENNISNKTGHWARIPIIDTNNTYNKQIIDYMPTLKNILDNFDLAIGYGLVFFSRTAPDTFIEAHYGSSNIRTRIHLGLDIPQPEKCWLNINKDIKKYWDNGKTFAFDDSYLHSSENSGTESRDVLIIDVFNPYLTESEMTFLKNKTIYNFGKIINDQN